MKSRKTHTTNIISLFHHQNSYCKKWLLASILFSLCILFLNLSYVKLIANMYMPCSRTMQQVINTNLQIQTLTQNIMLSDDKTKIASFQDTMNEKDLFLQTQLKEISTILPEYKSSVVAIKTLLQDAFTFRSQAILLAKIDHRNQGLDLLLLKYTPIMEKFELTINDLANNCHTIMENSISKMVQNIIVFILISFVLLMVGSHYIHKRFDQITKLFIYPVLQIEESMKKLAEGNLTIDLSYESENELGSLSIKYEQQVMNSTPILPILHKS